MKIKLVLLLSFLCVSSTYALECPTTLECDTDKTCACTVSADGGTIRQGYVSMHISQKHVYQCEFNSQPSRFRLNYLASTFPQGTQMSCQHCERFPTTLTINTLAMVKSADKMIINYQAPPSDIPSQLNLICQLKY